MAYRGETWSARELPDLVVGERVEVLWSPLQGDDGQGRAVAVRIDPESRRTVYHPLTRVEHDEFGFRSDAPVTGETYASPPEGDLESNRKKLARLASGTDS